MARSTFVILLVSSVYGCTLDRTGLGGLDGAAVSGVDGGRIDGGEADASMDGGADAAMDAGTDAGDGSDAGPDASMDAGVDSGLDAGRDAGFDAGVDSGTLFPGTALSFDGTDEFVRARRTIADDFTIEAWINTTTSRAGTQFYHGLGIVYSDVGGGNDDFGTAVLNDHFAFGVGRPDTTIESTTVVTSGAWVHVAATRDRSSGEIIVYVNGIREASVTAGNTGALDAQPNLEIGGNTIDSRYFAGTMDEVRVWNVVRTGAQILANMNRYLAGTESGLVAYWRFDDGSGAIASDSTSTGNDGSLGAGSLSQHPTWVTSTAPIIR